MQIHNQIRQEIIERIQNNLPNAPRIYNGRAFFTNIREELPAICVYLDNAERSSKTLGDHEWTADLHIALFMPFSAGEPQLDQLAEQVDQLITFSGYENIEYVRGSAYGYDRDDDGFGWMSATLIYEIDYGRAPIK